MKKLLSIIFLSLLLSGNAYSFTKKEIYFQPSCSFLKISLIKSLIGEPKLKLFESGPNYIDPWYSEEAIHWYSDDNHMIFSSLVAYTSKKPLDLFIFKLGRSEPINLNVIYLPFISEADYLDFIGYKKNTPLFNLSSDRIKDILKIKSNQLGNLLDKEIINNDSISFYAPDYGLKEYREYCEIELEVVEKPKKLF